MKKFLLFAMSCLLLALSGSRASSIYPFFPHEYYTVSYQPENYAPSDRQLNNPYRGWYHIYGYALSDTQPLNMEDIQKTIAKDKNQLVLLEINLRNYPDRGISPAGISQLDSLLLAWKDAGRQLILRFLYDWNGKARESEPKDISVIKHHMEQTAEVINRYKGCIYLMQGIYVGNCGEMNNSDYMSRENMCELANCLASVVDPSIFLSVRTPEHYRIINQTNEPLPAEDAFSGTVSARMGFFNDGMLGSESDLGTYGDSPFAPASDFTGKGTRSEEIDFQNRLCDYVPNGGEAVLDNAYNDFPNAIKDLRAMHVSYLDCGYDLAVLDKWRNSSYHAAEDPERADGMDNRSDSEAGCFEGMDGLSYIGAHLGYRYAIVSSRCTFDIFRNTSATLSVTMENNGFSVSYRPFTSIITILKEDGGVCDTIIADTDNRAWKSGEAVTWDVPLDIRAYGNGDYQVYYRLIDPATNRKILLANETAFTSHGYRIGSFTVGKNAGNTIAAPSPSETSQPLEH